MKAKFNPLEQLFIIMVCCLLFQQSLGQANTGLSNLVAPTKVNVSVLPGITNSIDLGVAKFSWRNIYAGTSYYINGTKVLHIKGTANTFVGNTGNAVNTGPYNTFIGHLAGRFNSSGSSNTATGYVALGSNTVGSINTAYGAQSLYSNNTGNYNTANGFGALYANTTGNYNSAFGAQALNFNTTGEKNVAIGFQALYSQSFSNSNTPWDGNNVAVGYRALFSNNPSGYFYGVSNTAVGSEALYSNGPGFQNTAVGTWALHVNNTGNSNTAIGNSALVSNTTGGLNTATGLNALFFNTTGSYNVADGLTALVGNTTGNYNTGIGYYTLSTTNAAWGNTAVGYYAGSGYNNGYYNTFIGSETGATAADIYNSTALGNLTSVTAPSQVRIGNSFVNSIGGYANWTNISDGRVKKNMKANVPGLVFINKLQPITYNLDLEAADRIIQRAPTKTADGKTMQTTSQELASRKQKEQIIYTGFVAQDVEKAAKEISFDFSGVDPAKNEKDLYGLRYSDFVAPLVKAVQELSAENEELKKRLDKLEALVLGDGKSISSARLEQNVPNPVDGSCYIAYYIPPGAHQAQLMFSDVVGRVLKSYSITASGYGKQMLNNNDLSSGMYQYSLLIDGKLVDTKKMLLVK